MHSNIDCICLTFSNVHFQMLTQRAWITHRQIHTGCICLTFLHCVFSNASSKNLDQHRQIHTGCIFLLISTVRFQICPQIACPRIGIFIFGCIHLHLFHFSPLCVFKCVLKHSESERLYSHIGCTLGFHL